MNFTLSPYSQSVPGGTVRGAHGFEYISMDKMALGRMYMLAVEPAQVIGRLSESSTRNISNLSLSHKGTRPV
jgi:hypothetical protein